MDYRIYSVCPNILNHYCYAQIVSYRIFFSPHNYERVQYDAKPSAQVKKILHFQTREDLYLWTPILVF